MLHCSFHSRLDSDKHAALRQPLTFQQCAFAQADLQDPPDAAPPACVAFGLQHMVVFATPARPGLLLLFDWQRRRVTRTVELPPAPGRIQYSVLSLAASPCGRLLAAGTSSGTYIICQHATAEPTKFSNAAPSAVAFCDGGRSLLAARGAAVEAWDTGAAMDRARLLLSNI